MARALENGDLWINKMKIGAMVGKGKILEIHREGS